MVIKILKDFYPIGSVNTIVITTGLSGFADIIVEVYVFTFPLVI
jgi:hypothetical protein